MRLFVALLLTAMVLAIAPLPVDAASKTTDVRSKLTEAQKAEIRKRAREYCKKRYGGGGVVIERVEILSDGRVRCWYRG